MKLASLVLGALLLGACGGSDKPVLYDFGIPDQSVPNDCASLAQCIAFCATDGGTSDSCVTACRATSTTAATMAYDAITSCVTSTCNAALDDSGTSICSDSSSVECMRCQTNSRYKDASDCTGAPPYCGACASEQAACLSS